VFSCWVSPLNEGVVVVGVGCLPTSQKAWPACFPLANNDTSRSQRWLALAIFRPRQPFSSTLLTDAHCHSLTSLLTHSHLLTHPFNSLTHSLASLAKLKPVAAFSGPLESAELQTLQRVAVVNGVFLANIRKQFAAAAANAIGAGGGSGGSGGSRDGGGEGDNAAAVAAAVAAVARRVRVVSTEAGGALTPPAVRRFVTFELAKER
jgi:hypothetical protein